MFHQKQNQKNTNNQERQVPARGANHNVGAIVLQNLLVLGNGKSSKEHTNLEMSLQPNGNLFYKITKRFMIHDTGVQHSFKWLGHEDSSQSDMATVLAVV